MVSRTEGGRARGTALAFDFGGTKLAVGLVDVETGDWISVRRRPTPGDATSSIEAVSALAEQMLTAGGALTSRQPVRSLGVSFGGHIDSATGVVRRSLQISGWEDVHLSKILRQRFGAPVEICNDGTAGAIGEWAAGAGRGLNNLVYLTVSTGVGGGLILDDQPYEGTAGFAAEFGHVSVEEDGAVCTCGLTGCLETVAAGPSLARRATQRIANGERSCLAGQAEPLTGLDVSEAAIAGDGLAIEVLAAAGRAVARVVSTLVIVLDPQAVLLGGGVAHAPDPFWTAFRSSIRTPTGDDRGFSVGPAEHIDDAPLLGARAIALKIARQTVEA